MSGTKPALHNIVGSGSLLENIADSFVKSFKFRIQVVAVYPYTNDRIFTEDLIASLPYISLNADGFVTTFIILLVYSFIE
jgi:hypothetical protein